MASNHQFAFKVEAASKLLPKLGSDSDLEVYLITFKKIATLNNWPKEHWSAVLPVSYTHLTLPTIYSV